MNLEDLEEEIERAWADCNKLRGQLDRVSSEKAALEGELEAAQSQLELLEKVSLLLKASSEYAREQARQQLERMVTYALQSVFGADLEFKVVMAERRDRPEADFLVSSTYGAETRVENAPQDARGGGVVDVISLALRIALLHASRPRLEGPIILDEPAKHVSEEYAMNVAAFLRSVSQSLGRQVIMVTHNSHLAEAADTAYRVELRGGKSVAMARPASP